MPLFFDLTKLEQASGNDPKKFVKLLEFHFTKKPPLSSSKYKPLANLAGTSFILHPAPLFEVERPTVHLVQYIKLAGMRDYFNYKQYNIVSLDTTMFPDLNWEAIKNNPLLQVISKQIHLKYEEIYHGIKVQRYQRQGSKEGS